MTMNANSRVSKRSGAALVCLLVFSIAVTFASGVSAQEQQGDAKAILKSMADYVGSQQTIEFTFDSDIEVITPQLEKIQFTNSGEALLSRPNKLRAHRVGGYADVALYFDGETASIMPSTPTITHSSLLWVLWTSWLKR